MTYDLDTRPAPLRATLRAIFAAALLLTTVAVAWLAFEWLGFPRVLQISWPSCIAGFLIMLAAWDQLQKAKADLSGAPYLDEDGDVPPVRLTVDEEGVTLREHGGRNRVQRIRYADLEHVWIVTTSEGPFVPDIFYELDDGQHTLTLPLEIVTARGLLDHLFALPGFDYKASIKASACTDDARFLAWSAGWS